MSANSADFERQLAEAAAQQMRGRDWSFMNGRALEEELPWDYRALVLEAIRGADALLDLGTGGGEFLAGLFTGQGAPAVPPNTWATEGYAPNVGAARARLAPLGIRVMDVSGSTGGQTGLPDAAFGLVIDRHEGIPGQELARILRPGGRYITQQVGGENCIELNQALGAPDPLYRSYTLDSAVCDLTGAGLRVTEAREVFPRWTFLDLSGVVFYLQSVPWQITNFTVENYRDKLYNIYQTITRHGGYTVHEHRILIQAEKPTQETERGTQQ